MESDPQRPSTWSTASAASGPKIEQLNELGPGEIGFITAQIKEISETRIGTARCGRPCY